MTGDGQMGSTGTVSYDSFGQRMRVRNYGISGNETFAVDRLMLYSQVYHSISSMSKLFFRIFFGVP